MSAADYMARFRRGRPDRRYALDPAHEQAIRNYLALTTRAHGVPQLHRAATPMIDQELGQHAPLFHQMVGGLLQHHDPAGLQALDLHQDVTGHPTPEVDDINVTNDAPHHELINLLAGLHHTLRGGAYVDVPRQFHPDRLRQDDILRNVEETLLRRGSRGRLPVDGYPIQAIVSLQSNLLGNSQRGPAASRQSANDFYRRLASNLANLTEQAHPRGVVNLHDLLSEIHQTGAYPDLASRGMEGTQAALHDVLQHLIAR